MVLLFYEYYLTFMVNNDSMFEVSANRNDLLGAMLADMAEWQTQQTQNLPGATQCGFKSHYPHL